VAKMNGFFFFTIMVVAFFVAFTVSYAIGNDHSNSGNDHSNSGNDDTNNVTVYITKTGSKYHRDGCHYLSKSKIAVSLNKLDTKKYSPCSSCKPPTKQTTKVGDNLTLPDGETAFNASYDASFVYKKALLWPVDQFNCSSSFFYPDFDSSSATYKIRIL